MGGASKPCIDFAIRDARPEDSELILEFIIKLASYDREGDKVIASADDIRRSLFDRKEAEVVIGAENGSPVAFAVYYQNYSTFLGRANLYLEDLFVEERCRGKGYGTAMLRHLARIAVRRGGERLDWLCLDFNVEAIDFYKSLGAMVIDDRRVFGVHGAALRRLAGQGLNP
ncbi:MAG: GNAT family N-acetyltransferase [Synergistaceae bacterium]|jgi:GNAT superfamily N-acetyltransferase|nr:GNAT family N-acetyltransferase [Synergistaceae bacterium]